MKERPILFSGPMVRAIIAGTKTQTRRLVKHPALKDLAYIVECGDGWWGDEEGDVQARCPYGEAGDRLWMRETHAPQPDCSLSWDRWLKGLGGEKPIIHYAADASERAWVDKWRPSIHMPRWASRATLDVTGLRAERLQDISESDALAEGIVQLRDGGFGLPAGEHYHAIDPRISYWSLWDHINGPGSVEANPWVWVIEWPALLNASLSGLPHGEEHKHD